MNGECVRRIEIGVGMPGTLQSTAAHPKPFAFFLIISVSVLCKQAKQSKQMDSEQNENAREIESSKASFHSYSLPNTLS